MAVGFYVIMCAATVQAKENFYHNGSASNAILVLTMDIIFMQLLSNSTIPH